MIRSRMMAGQTLVTPSSFPILCVTISVSSRLSCAQTSAIIMWSPVEVTTDFTSSRAVRGIDTIRTKVKDYARTRPIGDFSL